MSENVKTIIKLDSQELTAFQRCPRKYYFSYVRSIQGKGPKKALDIGTVFHALFEYVNKGLVAGEQLRDLVLPAINSPESGLLELPIEDRLFITKRFCEYYEHWEVAESKYKIISAETGFSKILYEDAGVVFIYEGRVDATYFHNREEMYVWRDYKTFSGQRVYKHCNQFLGYQWALSDNPVRGEIEYIGKSKDKTDKTFDRDIVSFHHSQIDRWVDRTIDTFWNIFMLRNSEKSVVSPYSTFEPNISACDGKYSVCSFHTLCERDPDIYEQLIMINYEPREKWTAW